MNLSAYIPRSLRHSLRRGRGPRRPLLLPEVSRWESRSEAFNQAAIDAYAPLGQRRSQQLSHLDIAIDTIPRMQLHLNVCFPEEIVADGPVPLGRFTLAGVDHVGNPTRPCVIVFRRPTERRASGRVEPDQMLQNVLTRLVVVYLGIDPVEVDPNFDENSP